MIKEFVLKINPDFDKWDELFFILKSFENWERDISEPPSSGAFSCASQSNDLAAGCAAFFSCSGDKHLPFEKCIKKFKTSPIAFGNGYGFGHPVYEDDPRVSDFFKNFPQEDWRMKHVESYMKDRTRYGSDKCINFAGLYGAWCLVNNLDERAAILPLLSRLLGLCITYEYNKLLPSSNECIKHTSLHTKSIGQENII